MKIVGQPADYSELLQRVFWFSMATGVVCTFLLAQVSPEVRAVLNSVSTEVDFGHLKSIKILYILLPGLVALFSRIIKLHDRISDILQIRAIFDVRFILTPLAKGTGIVLTKRKDKAIRQIRDQSMYEVFYKYAGFKNPVIDDQLVRTAADNWGWFWVFVESSFICSITSATFFFIQQPSYARGLLYVVIVELILLLVQWFSCIKSAKSQVYAILTDPTRKNEVRGYFASI